MRRAFTLIELMVVIAIIGILASLLLPALAGAKEKAKAMKVHAELYGLGLALEMYADDNENKLPPVRVDCNTDLNDHFCQFPVELAEQGYLPKGNLPKGNRPGMSANMEDVFNPGHTYKYAAPGPRLMNDSPGGNHKVWVPSDFPECSSNNGQWISNASTSAVRWVVWSMGPRPNSPKSQSSQAPLARSSWYRHTGDSGVLLRMATREGLQIKSP